MSISRFMSVGSRRKPYGRLHVNLDDSDEFGTLEPPALTVFGLWLHGWISRIKWFAVLLTFAAHFKRTTQSYRQPVYYVDLTLREVWMMQLPRPGKLMSTANILSRGGRPYSQTRFCQCTTDIEEGLDVLEEYYPEKDGRWSNRLHLKDLYRIFSTAECKSCELS